MMFGIDIDDVTLELIEINGTVYVPYHIETKMGEITTFVEYETVEEILDSEDGSNFDTDDYRYDP